MGLVNSCKDCQKRHIGCHGKCETYKAAKEELEKKKAYLNADAEIRGYEHARTSRINDKVAKHRKKTRGCSGFRYH